MVQSEGIGWGLAGVGNIGRELLNTADRNCQDGDPRELGLNESPSFIIRSDGIWLPNSPDVGSDLEEYHQEGSVHQLLNTEAPPLLVSALPSNDEAATLELRLTEWAGGQGGNVVTAAKGMMSNYWNEASMFTSGLGRLGYSATVGGGTRLLDLLALHAEDPSNVNEIHLGLNGTLAFLTGEAESGISFEDAASEAKKLGYAEPVAETALEVLKDEAEGDIPKKLAIVWNHLVLGAVKESSDFGFELEYDEIERVLADAGGGISRRFVVSIHPNNEGGVDDSDRIGGFKAEHDGHLVIAGFRKVAANGLFAPIGAYRGPAAGAVIGLGRDNEEGIYPIAGGPGAGPKPTVNAMLHDVRRLTHSLAI